MLKKNCMALADSSFDPIFAQIAQAAQANTVRTEHQNHFARSFASIAMI
jgi:hypothetical protein